MDILVENHGSILLFRPLTQAASDWIEYNVSSDRQYFGSGLVVEHRFVGDIIAGMRSDGLEVRL